MGFGNFYKGEKKKKKKGEAPKQFFTGPVFVPPKVISKEKEKF